MKFAGGLTWDEIHSFLVGFFEVICPFRPRINVSIAQLGYIQDEFPYYMGGRALAMVLWVVGGVLLLVWVLYKVVIGR